METIIGDKQGSISYCIYYDGSNNNVSLQMLQHFSPGTFSSVTSEYYSSSSSMTLTLWTPWCIFELRGVEDPKTIHKYCLPLPAEILVGIDISSPDLITWKGNYIVKIVVLLYILITSGHTFSRERQQS